MATVDAEGHSLIKPAEPYHVVLQLWGPQTGHSPPDITWAGQWLWSGGHIWIFSYPRPTAAITVGKLADRNVNPVTSMYFQVDTRFIFSAWRAACSSTLTFLISTVWNLTCVKVEEVKKGFGILYYLIDEIMWKPMWWQNKRTECCGAGGI